MLTWARFSHRPVPKKITHMRNLNPFHLFQFFCMLAIFGSAQTRTDGYWAAVNEQNVKLAGKRQIVPQKYLTYELNTVALKSSLFAAPHERSAKITESACIITLPAPDGSMQRFRVVESPVMAEALSAAYPDIKTFSVRGIDDVYANGKLDWNDFGFHGMIRSVNGDFFIDPYCVGDIKTYITYYTRDFVKAAEDIPHEIDVIAGSGKKPNGTEPADQSGNKIANSTPAMCVGAQLLTYRLAVTCTGEYAQAATGLSAPSIQQTLAKIVTSVNRVDGVYETDLAVRMVLVPTETAVIYTNPSTDPFTANNNGGTLLGQSQSAITTGIGSANFDIGHIFSTGGGGIAFLGCVCSNNDKARGVTGSANPVGDPYDIDYVAHEMGHQFEGNHTFNSITGSCNGNRNASTSTEPGSGVTVMAYAGICSVNDLTLHSIPYFHATSYDEIVNFTNSGGGSTCPTTATTGNLPPVVTGSGDYIIPKSTAFTLTGSAVDPDGDPLTYSWEEIDPGPGTGGNWNSGNKPYFRSYEPTTSPSRNFPKSSIVLSGNTAYTLTKGEYVPGIAQVLQFRLTARDNKMGGGGVCYAINNVTIDNSGPMAVTNPNTAGIVWNSGTQQTVTWDVNNTEVAPIGCTNVRILISLNGGSTFSVLVNSTLNDGIETVTSPTVAANITTCRIKVESIGNIFYDIGDKNFTISTSTVTGPSDVGISPVSENNPLGLSVWPNPAGNVFYFSAGNLNSNSVTRISVIDLLGKTVLQNEFNGKTELKETIDISSLNEGLYFVKVSNDSRQATYRIFKD